MRKVLSMVIALFLIISSVSAAAYAKGNNKGNDKWEKSYSQEMEKLKTELNKWLRNAKKRDEIMKKIMELKKKYDDDSLTIFMNGEEQDFEKSPVIKYGKFQLPTRPITRGLKADLKYNSRTNVITITKDNSILIIDLKNKKVTLNGNNIKTDLFENKNKNKTIVLIKYIANILGLRVNIDDDTGTVIIDDENYIAINNTDALIKYEGSWTYEQNIAGAFNNDLHKTNQKGASYSVTFTGTRVKIYGTTGPDHGIANISVGGHKAKVNLYSKDNKNNVLIYVSPELKKASHKLEVKVSGERDKKSTNSYVTLDKIEIANESKIIKGTDVALNKLAFADSQQSNNPASSGNDGKADTRWCANDKEVGHWWAVDLGALYNLTGSQITWEFPNKLYKYKLEASADGKTWAVILDKSNNSSTQQTQTDSFTANSVQYVRIVVTGLETGSWASFWDIKIFGNAVTTVDKQAPSVPSGLKAKPVSASQIDLSWNAATDNVGVTGYKVYRNGTLIATVTNSLVYSDKGLAAGTVYEYSLRAFDAAGNESGAAPSIKAATMGNGIGLLAEYFDDIALTPAFFKIARIDPTIDFNWSLNSPDTSIDADTFSIRWTGQVQALYTEKYTFHALSDDGVRVWVNNQLIIDDWSDHEARETTGTIDLVAGQKYTIKVEYFENSGFASAKLLWSSASQAKEVIPQSQLYLQ